MTGTVEIIEDEDGFTPLDEDFRERLELLGLPICFDFLHNELHFYIKEECELFDFEDFFIEEVDRETFEQEYLPFAGPLPDQYEETLKVLRENIDTNIYLVGENWEYCLVIQIYNKYIIIGNVIIDEEDFTPPDDPDGGEPAPNPREGIFLFIQ